MYAMKHGYFRIHEAAYPQVAWNRPTSHFEKIFVDGLGQDVIRGTWLSFTGGQMRRAFPHPELRRRSSTKARFFCAASNQAAEAAIALVKYSLARR